MKQIEIKVFWQIYVMNYLCQQIIDIISLQVLLAIKCNLQREDSFNASYFSFCAI